MKQIVPAVFLALSTVLSAPAENLVFKTPKGWFGERIALPTGFAPDMTLKGVEEIRFAPGMFKPDAADFFTYVFVF
ncbi:MAG: hypothetical protein AAF492_12705, partial [Verrucomicrobiota bacterium]